MKLNKKRGKFLNEAIDYWQSEEVITPNQADKLKSSFSIRPFDWKKLAKYSFWISIICVVIALGSIVADELLVEFIERFFNSSYFGLSLTFSIIAAGFYYWGLKRRKTIPAKVFSNEAILFIGVVSTAVAVAYLGAALDTGSGHYALLFLLSTAIYGGLGLWFPSKLVWVFSILSFGAWFGAETGYVSGWGAYYLGMNYPVRFVLFGFIMVAASFLLKSQTKLSDFFKPTYVLGLLYLFIALWILSIFGNYGDMESWFDVKQTELFSWGILFALVSLLAIIYGLKYDDSTSRSFGITFLFLNLYTKYFEYFWNSTHKAVFFSLLAVSFWLIGRKAESIWNLEFLQKDKPTKQD